MASACAIPFNRSSLAGKELQYVAEAVASGQIGGDGCFSRRCQVLLEQTLGVPKALLTTSCTHALEMCALLLQVQPGDEVIVPSFTFVSTANAFVLRGARPVFCDIRADTLNLDEAKLEALVTPQTKAVVPVHYAGVACEMDCIVDIAHKHRIAVVEDNAHGLFGKYKGRSLGSIGCLATQSFHATKNITCGEGGALLINDRSMIGRAEIIREKGTDRSRFFRGEVDKYSWVDIGSSYVVSDVLAAFLWGQLEVWQTIQCRRRRIWETYEQELRGWASQCGVKLPTVPPHCEQAYHLFYMVLPSLDARERLVRHLRMRGIHAVFHYLPLHLSAFGRRWGGRVGDCPVAESTADRLLRLPFYSSMRAEEQERVIEAVWDCKL